MIKDDPEVLLFQLQFFPKEGVPFFANLLHTHLIGKHLQVYLFQYQKSAYNVKLRVFAMRKQGKKWSCSTSDTVKHAMDTRNSLP